MTYKTRHRAWAAVRRHGRLAVGKQADPSNRERKPAEERVIRRRRARDMPVYRFLAEPVRRLHRPPR